MPAWGGRLDEPTIKALAVYVHTLRRRREVIVHADSTLSLDRAAQGAPGAGASERPSRGRGPRRRPSDDGPLYAARRKIYPQRVHGTFRRIKWAVLLVTLGIYYLLPFVRWDRGPNAPDQAVLIDLPEPPLLFLLHRDLAAGSLLPHRPADHRRDRCCS